MQMLEANSRRFLRLRLSTIFLPRLMRQMHKLVKMARMAQTDLKEKQDPRVMSVLLDPRAIEAQRVHRVPLDSHLPCEGPQVCLDPRVTMATVVLQDPMGRKDPVVLLASMVPLVQMVL